MGKRIRDYVKYTFSELERYAKSPSSCVQKINTPIHLNFPPYGLGNFRQTILHILAEKKIGFYDATLKGIILDIRNIKVIGDMAALRFDDPALHMNLQVDCYVFQPKVGAIVQGLVKHISDRQIGVIIYRVFSVSIRLNGHVPTKLQLNSDIEFRIKQFELENAMPFIEGELVGDLDEGDGDEKNDSKIKISPNKKIQFDVKFETGSSGYNSDGSHRRPTKTKPNSDSSSDSDESEDTKSNKQLSRKLTKSPDLFANTSSSESEVEIKPTIKPEPITPKSKKIERLSVKVKQEKLSQSTRNETLLENNHISNSDVSDIEPGQSLRSERLSQLITVERNIKQEIMSPELTKKAKSRRNEELSDVETKTRVKVEKSSPILDSSTLPSRKKKSIKIETETSMTENQSKMQLSDSKFKMSMNPPESTENNDSECVLSDAGKSRKRKKKQTDSVSDSSTYQSDGKVKKHKTSLSAAPVTTLIHLDSDFEMTAVEPAKKHKKKKKKSKDDCKELETSVMQLTNENEIVDLEDFAISSVKAKKKKSKEKDRLYTINNESFNSSLSSILAKIKAEKSV